MTDVFSSHASVL